MVALSSSSDTPKAYNECLMLQIAFEPYMGCTFLTHTHLWGIVIHKLGTVVGYQQLIIEVIAEHHECVPFPWENFSLYCIHNP